MSETVQWINRAKLVNPLLTEIEQAEREVSHLRNEWAMRKCAHKQAHSERKALELAEAAAGSALTDATHNLEVAEDRLQGLLLQREMRRTGHHRCEGADTRST